MNIIPPPIERALVGILLFWYTGAWHGLLFGRGGSRSDAVYVSTEATFVWLPAYAASLALFATVVPVILRRHLSTFALVALLLLYMTAGLSVLWSDAPKLSFRRSLSLTAVATFGVYLAVRFEYRDVLRTLALVYLFIVFVNFVYVPAFPGVGVETGNNAGDWRGTFSSKNPLGRSMSVAFSIFLCALLSREVGGRLLLIVGALLSLALLILSNSITAFGMTFIAVTFVVWYAMYTSMSRFPRYLLAGWMLGLLGFVFILFSQDPVGAFAAVDRDITLSGRTIIWSHVWADIQKRFWLGYGLEAYWFSAAPVELWSISRGYAHNGLLESWLSVGIVGVALLLALVLRTLVGLLRAFAPGDWLNVAWPTMFILMFLAQNFTEGSAIRGNLVWILFIYVALRTGAARVATRSTERLAA